MASNQESDSDSELVFEDAVEDITTEKINNNIPCVPAQTEQQDNDEADNNKSTPKKDTSLTKNTDSAKCLKEETVVHSEDNLCDRVASVSLNESRTDESPKQTCDEEQNELPKEQGVDSKTDEEETESCSDSEGEFDEETVDELMKEATGEEDSKERLKGDDESDEEEEDSEIKIDEEALKERDETLTEEEKEELRERAQQSKAEGNRLFKEGNYLASVVEYTSALQTCPLCYAKERSIMYSNRGAAKLHLEKHDAAIEDCTKAVELNPNYMKALLRRAELYERTEKLDEALSDYTKVLEMDPGQHGAREAAMRLPDQIKERNEKMKEEMMGKLKDLGNMILKPFGLSTNNFQLNQDPNTGGYSVNFSQGQQGPPQ